MREVFLKVLNEYTSASSMQIAEHPLAGYIRNQFNGILEPLLPSDIRYIVKGSPGQGNWGRVPWVATFDSLVTTTAQKEYYLTYLFKADMSGVYLNLNQGVTDIQRRYKAKAKEVLEIKAKDFKAQLGSLVGDCDTGKIDLGSDLPPSVELYNYGSICSKFYSKESFPSDEELILDYKMFLDLYAYLVDNDNSQTDEEIEVAEVEPELLYEDTRRKRKHDRIERNPKLAKLAKKIHGYICQACGFNFEEKYGELGKHFIEAHHLVPLSTIVEQKIPLDPATDFAVLCSNCHRMIHRLDIDSGLEHLKKSFI